MSDQFQVWWPYGIPIDYYVGWVPDFAKCADNYKPLPVRNKTAFVKNLTVTVVTKLLCCTFVDMAVVSLVIMNSVIPRECLCTVHYLSQISKELYGTICHHFHTAKYFIFDAVKKILSHPKLNVYQYI